MATLVIFALYWLGLPSLGLVPLSLAVDILMVARFLPSNNKERF